MDPKAFLMPAGEGDVVHYNGEIVELVEMNQGRL